MIERDIYPTYPRRVPPTRGGSGDTYKGQFKVKQTDAQDQQVDVVWGYNPSLSTCGRAIVGDTVLSVNKVTGLSVTAALSYIVAEITYTVATGVWSTEIVVSTTYPVQGEFVGRYNLAVIEVDTGAAKITGIHQEQYGEIITNRIG